MKLPPGFKATVFAAEPDVRNPIAMAWDGAGRVYVAENYTYAEMAVRFDLKLRDRIRAGDLGTVQHIEASMTYPNALFLPPTAWRSQKSEAPLGGLTPMGVHAIDGMIYLTGEIEQVYCQSF